MDKEPITTEGLEKLKSELIFLKEKKRPEIVAAIAEARSHGDLKENAEYHAAKEQQSHNEGRIQEVEDLIARANVIDITKISNDGKVIFGSTVYLQNYFQSISFLNFLIFDPIPFPPSIHNHLLKTELLLEILVYLIFQNKFLILKVFYFV